MFKSILIIILFSIFTACSFSKKATIEIKNNNDYEIDLTFITNNIQQTYNNIKPSEKFNGIYDWTKLNKNDGEFLIVIKNNLTNQTDTFHHGQFFNGELGNYIDIECQENQTKIVVSD